MTAERRRAATDDGVHHLAVLWREMRSVPLEKAVTGSMEDVGHLLKGGPAHLFTRSSNASPRLFWRQQATPTAGHGLQLPARPVQRDRRVGQLGVPKQHLNGAEIRIASSRCGANCAEACAAKHAW